MASLLLALIYLAFVSMGLPDALLGSAWPTVYQQLNVPISYAGILSILIASSTVVSSLMSDRLIRRFGTGPLTAVCTLMTAAGLFGFSISNAFWQLCLWALPYGLGAGSIDAALNNYVALKYKSRHMSWIHFFWGLGATVGPYIMGSALTGGAAWTDGYRLVGIVQTVMTALLFLSLPLWKPTMETVDGDEQAAQTVTKLQVLRLPGGKEILIAFFCYCGLETTAGLWASSYMTLQRGIAPEVAAKWASLFYLGITAGRFLNGFITDRLGDRRMVRIGQCCIIAGTLVLLLSLGNAVCFAGLIMIGLGCAPVYPCLLHETPENFGIQNSQTIMGLQMACAYIGSTLMPPVFGLIAQHLSISLYPVCLLLLAGLMYIMAERMNRLTRRHPV